MPVIPCAWKGVVLLWSLCQLGDTCSAQSCVLVTRPCRGQNVTWEREYMANVRNDWRYGITIGWATLRVGWSVNSCIKITVIIPGKSGIWSQILRRPIALDCIAQNQFTCLSPSDSFDCRQWLIESSCESLTVCRVTRRGILRTRTMFFLNLGCYVRGEKFLKDGKIKNANDEVGELEACKRFLVTSSLFNFSFVCEG